MRWIDALVQRALPFPRRTSAAAGQNCFHFGDDRERDLIGRLGPDVKTHRAAFMASAATRPAREAPSYTRTTFSSSLIRGTRLPSYRRLR